VSQNDFAAFGFGKIAKEWLFFAWEFRGESRFKE